MSSMVVTRIFAFFGPPGSGKGTLSGRCQFDLAIPVLSTGNLCRKHVELQTSFGKQFKAFLDEGKLIPDQLMADMVIDWINEHKNTSNTLVLDGFPRTRAQAELLNSFLKRHTKEFIFVPVVFDISDRELVARLTNRLVCSNKDCQYPYSAACPPKCDMVCDHCGAALMKRSDDVEHVALQRIVTYREHVQDLMDYFHAEYPVFINVLCQGRTADEIFAVFSHLVTVRVPV